MILIKAQSSGWSYFDEFVSKNCTSNVFGNNFDRALLIVRFPIFLT